MRDHNSFGEWLRERRKARDLTQDDLAERTGLSSDTIRKYESGERTPAKGTARIIARALGVPEQELDDFEHFARQGEYSHDFGDVKSHLPAPNSAERIPHRPTNRLPAFPTTFVGREKEVEQLRELLLNQSVRLVTVTGTAGIGKTRLATYVAATLRVDYSDWVFFVPLSHVTDPAMVVPTICKYLEIKEVSGQPLIDALMGYLRDKEILLFLDNFEQVVPAGAAIGEMLLACPSLKVLATSRETLHVYGEQEFPVPEMALPKAAAKELPGLEALARYEAVDLFTQRTRAVTPGFELTEENAATVVEICRRLDALPLAIELAAARSKVLPPQGLLARLDRSLNVLTAGMQDLPVRQRTLRGAIAWSYDLLNEEEKTLFRRMSVFVGFASLDAVEQVSDFEAWPLEDKRLIQNPKSKIQNPKSLDLINSLLDKTLVRQDERQGEPKFWMLWTIREFAQEEIEESGEAQETRRRHAAYFLQLAEEAEPYLTSAGRAPWLERLEAEHANLRAALDWCLSEDGDKEMGLRLAGALGWYWYFRSYYTEGRDWLEKTLALAGPLRHTAMGAKALDAVGRLSLYQNNFTAARSWLEESVEVWRDMDDTRGLAYALCDLGITVANQAEPSAGQALIEEGVRLFQEIGDNWGLAFALDRQADAATWLDDPKIALKLYSESLSQFRKLGDNWGIAMELRDLGYLTLSDGDYTSASSMLEEGLAMQREIGDRLWIAVLARTLGDAVHLQGDYERAEALYNEALDLYRELGNKVRIAHSLGVLGHIARHWGDYTRARKLYEESSIIYQGFGYREGIMMNLAGLAELACAQGQYEIATCLLGATSMMNDAILARHTYPFGAIDLVEYEHTLDTIRRTLDEAAFAAAWERGQAMDLEQAIAYALEIRLAD